jgi:hypothetical protein
MTLASEAPQNKHQTLGQKSDAYKKNECINFLTCSFLMLHLYQNRGSIVYYFSFKIKSIIYNHYISSSITENSSEIYYVEIKDHKYLYFMVLFGNVYYVMYSNILCNVLQINCNVSIYHGSNFYLVP